ncbi:methyltransferase domain-containing protein [Patescibacteria group bacterium]|nr:methyltransferase domain-containing protein [Patescibacteria group bacterium]
MRKYTSEKYIELVEKIDDPVFQSWQRAEMDVIGKVKDSKNKTFIDLGAGYGRVLPDLVKIARNVISIDINPDMIAELERRTKMYKNATAIGGDIQGLSKLLEKGDVKNPVLLIIQNTLGTIEGDYKKVLSETKSVAEKYQGEVIISILRQEVLKDYGMRFYTAIQEMTGEPDLENIDFERGIFRSKTGYQSKWWTSDEIEEIKSYFGGKVVNEFLTPHFAIIHISF